MTMTKVCGAIGGLVGCERSLGRGCTARYLSANSITILLTSPPLCTLPASLLTATALTFYIYLSLGRDVDDGEQANQQWQPFDINNKHRQQQEAPTTETTETTTATFYHFTFYPPVPPEVESPTSNNP